MLWSHPGFFFFFFNFLPFSFMNPMLPSNLIIGHSLYILNTWIPPCLCSGRFPFLVHLCNFYSPESYQIFTDQHKYFLLHEALFYLLRRNKSFFSPSLEIDILGHFCIVFAHIISLFLDWGLLESKTHLRITINTLPSALHIATCIFEQINAYISKYHWHKDDSYKS